MKKTFLCCLLCTIAGCSEVGYEGTNTSVEPTPTIVPKEGCDSNADCTQDKRYCLNRECVQCADSSHCGSNQQCTNHVCTDSVIPEPPKTCDGDYVISCNADGY